MSFTTQELKDIYASLKDDYRPLRKKQAEWKTYIDRTFETGLDKDKYDHIVKLPTALWIVESPVNYMALDKIRVNQSPKFKGVNADVTQDAQKTADAIGSFCQSLISSWTDIPPYFFRMNLKHLVRYGEACYRISVAPEIVRGDKEYTGLPFLRPEPVHPLSVMSTSMVDDFGCPTVFFRESLVYVMDLQKMAEKWNKQDPKIDIKKDWSPRDKLLLLEWWSEDERGYLAGPENSDITKEAKWDYIPFDGEPSAKNLYRFVPYIIGDSGLGEQEPDGKPEHYKKGILEGLEDAIIQQSRNETRYDTIAAFLTWPEEKWILSGGDVALTATDVARKPGQPVVSTPTKQHEWGTSRAMPDALVQITNRTDGVFERYQPSVVRGAPTPGEPAASVASRHDWATQNLWEGIHLSSKYMLTCVVKLVLKTIDTMKLNVEWGGVKVGHEMISGHYAIELRVRSGDQEEQRWKREQGKGLKGLISPIRMNEEYFEIDNATKEVKEVFAWNMVEAIMMNLNGQIGQSIVPMIAEGVRLKLIDRQVLPENGGQMNQPPPPQGGSPAVNGSPGKGITALPNRTPDADQSMQRLMSLMNTPAGR